jgi:hypothetical protein
MWDDVIIGEGEKLCSAVAIAGYENISENRSSFWISESDSMLGIGGVIYKNTPEGLKIIEMIKNKDRPIDVQFYIDDIFIKNSDINTIFSKIQKIRHECFKQGMDAKAEEIVQCLNLR